MTSGRLKHPRPRQRTTETSGRQTGFAASTSTPDLKPLWISMGLVALTLIVYAQVRHFAFVGLDDPHYVSDNPDVASGLIWRGVIWSMTSGHAANWHPLTWISHMLDVQMYGLNAGAHHLTNVLLHSANTVLLFWVLHRMTGAIGRSAFVAALFAVHPLHVESVAWVSERKDVLSTFFWLLSILAYFEYARRPRLGRYFIVVLCFVLGLMSKPMVVTLPFVLLLLDVWPLDRATLGTRPPTRSALDRPRIRWIVLVREKVPLLCLSAASAIITFIVQNKGGAVRGLDAIPLDRRLGNAIVAYVAYIGKMLWPTRLVAFYPFSLALPGWQIMGAAGILAVLSIAVAARARGHEYLPVGWLWYLGTLVPVIGIVQVGGQAMADRYTYIPLIGLFIIVAWGASDLLANSRSRTPVLATAAVITTLACAILAWRQTGYWANTMALWQHALDVTTDNYRAHNNVANALADLGRVDEAAVHYAEALRIKPDFPLAHNNLGNLLAGQGKVDEASRHYSEALRINPDFAEAHNGLGSALDDQGRFDEALAQYSEALRLNPDYADAHNNLGAAFLKHGDREAALQQFLEAVRLKPTDARFHYNAAYILSAKGQTSEAIVHLQTALSLDPGYDAARRGLDALTSRSHQP